MNSYALYKTFLFLCVIVVNKTLVLCSFDNKASSAGFRKTSSDNYSSLSKKAFESDDSFNYKNPVKYNYSSLTKLAYELDHLSNSNTSSNKDNFASLSKLAFELDDFSHSKKSSENNYASLTKAAYELDELSDMKKDPGNHNYASIAKLAFQLYDFTIDKTTDKQNYASLARLAFQQDEFLDVKSFLKKDYDTTGGDLKELLENLKFYTNHTTTTLKLYDKSRTLNLTSYDNLRLMSGIQYNVETELSMVDFFFNPSVNCEMVSYNDKKIWEKGDGKIYVPSTMTYDLQENELIVRENLRYLTYRKMANGSWSLKTIELLDTYEFYLDLLYVDTSKSDFLSAYKFKSFNDFVVKTLQDKGLSIYTMHQENMIFVNNLEAYQLSRIGKFNGVFVFKFHSDTKCVGVEYHGKNVWSYNDDDTPLLQDELTKTYPTRIIFNTRSNTTYVMFKNTYYVFVKQLKGYYFFKVNLIM